MWILCFTVIFALPISLICETYIEVGDNLFRLPIVISYIGPVECGTIDCDDEDGFYSIGAIELAKKYINNRKDLHYFHNLNITLYNTLNNAKRPVQMTVDAVNDPSSIGIIGFMEMCTNEAAIAGVYNKIGIAHSCSSDIATKDGFSRSFIQLSPSPKVIGQSTVALLYHYNWSHVSLLSPVNEITSFYQRARDYLIYQLQSNNISIIEDQRIQINRLSSTASYADQFTSLLSHSRIIIVLDPTANCFVLRQLLYSKYETLLDGEHAIVGIISSEKNGAWMATSNSESKLCPPAFHEDGGANLTQSQLHALYQNLLVISDSAPPEWSDTNWRYFRDKISAIRHHLPCPPYCLLSRLVPKANYHWARTARLYDSLILLAEAGREALDSGIDIRYGTQYYEYLISRHYKSITGEEEYLNGDGLLVGTLQLNYFFHSAKHASSGLWPIGRIRRRKDSEEMEIYQYSEGWPINWITGEPPSDLPPCQGENCEWDWIIISLPLTSALVVFLLIVVAFTLYRRYRFERRLHSLDFLIHRSDVILKRRMSETDKRGIQFITSQYGSSGHLQDPQTDSSHRQPNIFRSNEMLDGDDRMNGVERKSTMASMLSIGSLEEANEHVIKEWNKVQDFAVGIYQGNIVAIKRIYKGNVSFNRETRTEILQLRDSINDNLLLFKGIIIEFPNVFIVSEIAPRGNLRQILENSNFPFDSVFISSMLRDILNGLDYLHSSSIGAHGRLKSTNCLIDSRWVVRLSSFGLRQLRAGEQKTARRSQGTWFDLWSAPEILRAEDIASCPIPMLQKGDIYSLSIIIYEIIGRGGPWGPESDRPQEVISRVLHRSEGVPAYRPSIALIYNAPRVIIETCVEGWAERPSDRPPIAHIKRRLRDLTKGKKTIMENMVAAIEKYTTKLETEVAERTAELEEERKKSERLLELMLPPSVAESLKNGGIVTAEAFDSVTVFFSDCYGFTEMSVQSTPIQIVQFLNDLYTCFDGIISQYDVYKVETVGDTYMVASGLPLSNGFHHAGEIASMSLALLKANDNFVIKHRPGEKVQLRIGMHSGPCVAGVIGIRMPRYCLFGDTVNTASRMESNGIPLKINCSQSAKDLLDHLGGYKLTERGYVEMKGKGRQMTYFVLSEDLDQRRIRLKKEHLKYPSLRRTAQATDTTSSQGSFDSTGNQN